MLELNKLSSPGHLLTILMEYVSDILVQNCKRSTQTDRIYHHTTKADQDTEYKLETNDKKINHVLTAP